MMNEGVEINCKAFMTQVFTVHLVELGTAIEKSKGYIETSTSINEPYVKLNYNSPPSLVTFSEVHFSLTYKMYVNLGQTLDRFLINVDVEMNSYATS